MWKLNIIRFLFLFAAFLNKVDSFSAIDWTIGFGEHLTAPPGSDTLLVFDPTSLLYIASIFALFCYDTCFILLRYLLYIAPILASYCSDICFILLRYLLYIAPIFALFCYDTCFILLRYLFYFATIFVLFCYDICFILLQYSA